MTPGEKWRTGIKTFVRRSLCFFGALCLIWIFLCLTRLPMRAYSWLSEAPGPGLSKDPDVIIVLGGGGIPSESGLLRCYEGAVVARKFPLAEVIVSLPADGDPDTSSVGRMRDELVMRGVDRNRIRMETHAVDTHQQAEAIRDMLADRPGIGVLIVTSEFHLRRSILAFRKAGLSVTGHPCLVVDAEANTGLFLNLRYGFWHNLTNSVNLFRELVALAVYRLHGWI